MAFGETVECLARNEVQGDLSFELDAMDAVLGHGFHPLKARQRQSIPNLQTVHRHGRIPVAPSEWRPPLAGAIFLRGLYLLNRPMICALAKVLKCKLKPTTAAEVSGFTSSLSAFTANTVNR